MPKVSIIIPVYNAEKHITRCIESIENQTYKDFKAILVNDGSTDDSLSVLKTLEKKYDFIKVFTQENKGAASARNHGLEKADGEFVCFVDADDWLENDYLSVLVENQKENNADISMIGINKIQNSTAETEFIFNSKKIYENTEDIRKLQAGCFCNRLACFETDFIGMGTPWDKLFRLCIIRKNNISFNTDLKTGEDTLFCWQYFNFVKSFVYENKALYNYVVYQDSLSRKFVELKTFYDTINIFFTVFDEKMPEITKEALYYVIFRHFLSLLKKHFAHRENRLSLKEYKAEMKEAISREEMKFSIANISEKYLSRKEKIILRLTKRPELLAFLLFSLSRLK